MVYEEYLWRIYNNISACFKCKHYSSWFVTQQLLYSKLKQSLPGNMMFYIITNSVFYNLHYRDSTKKRHSIMKFNTKIDISAIRKVNVQFSINVWFKRIRSWGCLLLNNIIIQNTKKGVVWAKHANFFKQLKAAF